MRIGRDKAMHFGACALVAVTGSLLARAFAAPWACGMVLAVYAGLAAGLGKEYGDHAAPGNRWDWGDVWADLAGALTGAALGALTWVV